MIGYACVHVGKSLLWAGEDALTLYVMVRFLALPPALAGTIFLASALWNALCDGVIGALLSRSAAMRRWMPFVSIPAVLASALGFAALPLMAGRSSWGVAALLLLFRTGFSLADVPHNGLTRVLVRGGHDLAVARLRAIGSGSAAIIIGLASIGLLSDDGADGRMVITLAMGIAIAALFLMAPLPFLLAADRAGETPVSDAPRRPTGNRAFWIFAAFTVLGLAGLGAFGKALLHLRFAANGLGPSVLLLATVGRLGAVWLWSPVARRIGARRALGLAYALCAMAALLLAPLAGGGGAGMVALLLLFGIASGGVAFLSWAVLTCTIDSDDMGNFTAAFGAYTMVMKVALGLSAVLVGTWLWAGGMTIAADPTQFWPLDMLVALTCGAAGLGIAGGGFDRREAASLSVPALSVARRG